MLRGVQVNFVCSLMLNKEFQRPGRRMDDNIKIGLTDTGWGYAMD